MSANDLNYQYRKWLIKAPLGLVLTGFGAALISEAAMKKSGGAPTTGWVIAGTVALAVFNSGLSVLVDAGKHRAHFERLRDAGAPTPSSSTPS